MGRRRNRKNSLWRMILDLPGLLIYYLTFQFLFVARNEDSVPLIWRIFYFITGPFVAVYYLSFRVLPNVAVVTWRTPILRNLLFGSPFLVVMAFATYVGVNASNVDFATLANRYESLGKLAIDNGQLDGARVYLERVIQIRGNDDSIIFELCKAAKKQNDSERYLNLLSQLAPDDSLGYGPAHLEKARYLLENPQRTADDVLAGEKQILAAYQLVPDNPDVRKLLGEFYVSLGQWNQAEPHFEFASRSNQDVLIKYAQVLAILKKTEFAKQVGRRSLDYYTEKLDRNPADTNVRISKAEALNFLEQFEAALETIESGKGFGDNPLFNLAIARICVNWSDSLPSDNLQQKMAKFALLDRALKANPREPLVFDRIMKLLLAKDEAAKEIRNQLYENIANGHGLLTAHLLLGTIEGQEGNNEAAIRHLSLAYAIDESSLIVINNLAWYLSHSPQPDLPKALELIELVLSKWPEVPEYVDTRGEIYLLMGDYDKAFRDLQFSLTARKFDPRVHESLATIYEKRGLPELAKKHREEAKAIRASPNGAGPY